MNKIKHPEVCRACDSSISEIIPKTIKGFVEGDEYEYVVCNFCGSMLSGVANNNELISIYDAIYKHSSEISGYKRYNLYSYFSSSIYTKYLYNVVYSEIIYYGVYKLIQKISKEQNRNLKILEIGSGLGYYTARLRKYGHSVTGCDLSDEACTKAAEIHGGNFIVGDINNVQSLQGKFFDVIILLEAIEHMEFPVDFFSKIITKLAPKGSIIITTPNVGDKKTWISTEPPIHLSCFSVKGISSIGSRIGATTNFYFFGNNKKNLNGKELPGCVMFKNLAPNLGYFDNGAFSLHEKVLFLIKNITNRVLFPMKKAIYTQDILLDEGHGTLIARFNFNK